MKYIQMTRGSNISLAHYITTSAQIWMITHYDLAHTFWITVLQLMFLSICKASILETFIPPCYLGSWTASWPAPWG